MGVTELWSILEPARESVPLYSLTGKTLAVDLSLWVCEAQQVQAMMGKVHKPHLRNLFFRVSSLTLMGVKLVFVMEGEAPKLKADTMSKRTEMRFGGFQKKAPKPAAAKSTSRGRFNAVLRECGEMLDCLGVPWVTAAGEAEAMCAFLDLHGFVDGCITNDGDAFLYGAQTVYKNFNMNTKDPQVDCYKMSKVQEELHLSRETLVGFAMLLGCDYIPKGVPGVGKELALKLIQSLNGKSLLQKFREWAAAGVQAQEMAVKKVPHCNVCHHPGSAKAHERSGCTLCDSTHFCQPQDYAVLCPCDWHRSERLRQANATETTVRKKTLACERFPFTEIIEEFLVNKDKPIQPLRKRKPNLLSMQNFALDKMEWPKHYTSEKVLTLMTYTELVNKRHGRDTLSQIQPVGIYKPRVRNGISCFEVIWKKPEHYAFPDGQETEDQDVVRTVEEEALFRVAYPDIVDLYIKQKEEAEENKNKKKKPRSKKEKSPDVCDDDVSDLLARMSLKNTPTESTTSSTTAAPARPAEERPEDPSCTEGNQDGTKKEDTGDQLDVKPNAEKPPSSPLPGPASPAVTSLSTPTLLDKLHLSDIDWEAWSFTTSQSQAGSSSKIDQESAERVDTEALGSGMVGSVSDSGSQDGPASNRTELLPENEPCSLRERLLMRNALKSLSSCSERNECVNLTTDESSEAHPIPLERADSIVVTGHSKADTGHSGTEKSRSVLPQSQAQSKKPAQLYLSHKAAGGCNAEISTLKAVTTSTTAHKAKQPNVVSTNASAKYKFVRTNKEYAPALLQQTNSDDLTSRKQPKGPDPKPRKVSKPSVCIGPVYSSDDSDVENQLKRGQRWTKANKAKSKPTHPTVHNHIPAAAKTASAPQQKPLSVTDPRSEEIPGVSLSERVQQRSQRAEVEVIDLCLSAPASPLCAAPSANDDSIISIESPLPLAQRLKLKFVK
ncbi:flap endonuclease GEN homolog 1 [Alosa pseudoharengus]|uniref:flap endonuclease GEN homolog 1 n=1 Tax=Alosa pseudoharengus TaxID=34774 RepID=UPI003F8C0FB8